MTTLVSALFYIEDRYLEARHARYRTWVRRLLSLDAPLVIQTDSHYYDFIYEHRRQFDPEFRKTRLILTRLCDLDCYKAFYDPIVRLAAGGAQNQGPVWSQPLYVMALWNKLWILDSVARENPMATEWFCWLDAGGIRRPISPDIKWPVRLDLLDSQKFNAFCLQTPKIIPRGLWRQNAADHGTLIQGGAFIGREVAITTAAKIFKEIARDCTENGFIASDQRVLDFCYSLHPEMFYIMDATRTPSLRDHKDSTKHWFFRYNFFEHLLSSLT